MVDKSPRHYIRHDLIGVVDAVLAKDWRMQALTPPYGERRLAPHKSA